MVPVFEYAEGGQSHRMTLERLPNGQWVIANTAWSRVVTFEDRARTIARYARWVREILESGIPREEGGR